ncbi:thioester-containing protein 1 allele R1-like [Chironomus tepperi]|uniref:thioester-containing protein 1 allele R1-like n=1 Tax=Chironomus tepperi TaxID=113505 RepID=UPI00391F053C
MTQFLFVFILLFSGCLSQSVSLIGSRYVSDNSTYKAYLITNNLDDDSSVNVAFGPKSGYQTTVKDVDRSQFKELNFDVTPDEFNDYELKISSKHQNSCQEQSVNLIKTSNVPIVFIQFNKPIYKTSETFEFRIFILSQKLVPISKVKDMTVTISSPRRVVWSQDKISAVSEYGTYENSVKIADIPKLNQEDLGTWSINVDVDGKKATKSFEIQTLNKDDTEVYVQVPSDVAFEDRRIYLNILTKEFNGRYAAIAMQAKFINSSRVEVSKHVKSQYLTDIKSVIALDFQQDLGLNFPTADMILTFTVDIVDGQKVTTVIKDVKMKHKGRQTIQVIRKKYFKPGFKFPIKVRVKLLDGRPDNSLNQLSTTIKYLSSNKNENIDEKTYETNLKNGDAVHVLHPKAKTVKIVIQLKFADTEHVEEIDRLPGVDEYLQVTMVSKGSKVGSKIQMKAQSTEEMEQLHLLIFGTNGIIHSEIFEDSEGKDVYEFSLQITDEMRPEARGLVFYTRLSDGAIIYDEFSLNIGFSINNSLEFTAPDQAEPNQLMNIEVKTEKDSQVFLIAIDANAELFNGDNGISRSSVYDEIAYYINKKFTNPSDYQFEKFNGFILEPLKNGISCKNGQKSSNNDEEIQENSARPASSQKYFPATIPELNFIATADTQTVQMPIPDSTTKWKIYGISVHPTKGFTVAKTQPEISVKGSVKSGVKIDIDSPSTVGRDEVHQIKVTAKNMQQSHANGVVTLNIEDGMLLGDKMESKSWNTKCRKYFNGRLPLTYAVQFNPQKSIDTKYFNIAAKSENPIKITAKFESATGKSEAAVDVPVSASEKLQKEVVAVNLINLNQKTPNFILQLPNNASTVKTFVDVYGNLLGPALDGLENVFGRQMFLDEEKILKFQTAIINYKFLDSIGQSNSDKAKTAKREVFEGGKEALDILKNISKDKTRLWMSAFIIRALKDAAGLVTADQKLITESLNFIATQQVSKQYRNAGSFNYYPETDDHKDIGAGMREHIQNALIVTAFTKDSIQPYKEYILNSLTYLYSKNREFTGDYVNVVMAYTFALFGNKLHAAEFLNKLNRGYSSSTFKKHHSMYVEIISYLILTKILIGDDPRLEVEQLLAHRKADGAFYSPYDTVLAHQALYEYTKYKKSGKSFVFEVDGQQNMIGQDESKLFGPFLDPQHEIIVTTQGLGYALVYQELNDNAAVRNSISALGTSVKKVGSSGDLEISFDYKFSPSDRDVNSNLLVLEVEIPKGYKASFGKKNFQDVEFRDNGSIAVFYSHNIKKNIQYRDTMVVIKDSNELEYHKPLKIKLYDYYRPNIIDTYTYDLLCIQS